MCEKDLAAYLEELAARARKTQAIRRIATLRENRMKQAAEKPSEFRIPTQTLERVDPLQSELERIFMEGVELEGES